MTSESTSPLTGAGLDLLNCDSEYLVGVSGGRDSIVLLDWLWSRGIRNLLVCHFNHCLRGTDSDEDELFVRKQAESLGLECLSIRNDSKIFATQSRQSLETAARESRYRFFARVSRERSCHQLILAHHADDQVETVLMNLFRGAGLKGLGGMEPISHREIDGIPLEIIRPFLKITRADLEHYRATRNLAFREDATNSEPFATRNRVRHELLPLASEIFSRDPSPAILRLSEIAAMEYSASQTQAAHWLARLVESSELKVKSQEDENSDSQLSTFNSQLPKGLPLKSLRQLPAANLHHVIHLWLQHEKVADCGFQEVKMIIAMIRSDAKPAKVNLPGGRFARRRAGCVFLVES